MGASHSAKIRQLLERDGSNCHYCETSLDVYGPRFATKDHVVPRSRGGSNALWNLVLACEDCNRRKASRIRVCYCDFCNKARELWKLVPRRPFATLDEDAAPVERNCRHLHPAAFCLNCAGP